MLRATLPTAPWLRKPWPTAAGYCSLPPASLAPTDGVSPLLCLWLSFCCATQCRENAKETFAYFHAQGVTVKVISGDNPVTVSAAAREAGIEGADRYVDASTLETYEDIEAACEEYNVFGRVKPNQKKLLIQALQSNKHTVAMTGDGVNDVLALKEADCSVAMASGSDVAAQISDLVLMNSDFSSMPSVVAEGRGSSTTLNGRPPCIW